MLFYANKKPVQNRMKKNKPKSLAALIATMAATLICACQTSVTQDSRDVKEDQTAKVKCEVNSCSGKSGCGGANGCGSATSGEATSGSATSQTKVKELSRDECAKQGGKLIP